MIERYWSVSFQGKYLFRTELRTDMTVEQAMMFTASLKCKFTRNEGYEVTHYWRENLPFHMVTK